METEKDHSVTQKEKWGLQGESINPSRTGRSGLFILQQVLPPLKKKRKTFFPADQTRNQNMRPGENYNQITKITVCKHI